MDTSAGKSCEKFWKLVDASGGTCYAFENPNADVFTPWDYLELTMSLNESNAGTIGRNSFTVTVLLAEPGKKPSIFDSTSQIYVKPGNHHDLAVDIFEYRDTSGRFDCIPKGAGGYLVFDDGYSYNYCLDECETLNERTSCGCDIGVPSHQHIEPFDICGNFVMLFCQKDSSLSSLFLTSAYKISRIQLVVFCQMNAWLDAEANVAT